MSRQPHSLSPRGAGREDVGILPRQSELAPVTPRDDDKDFLATSHELWSARRFLLKALIYGLIVSFAVAFLIPAQYTSSVRLMPPDQRSGLGLGMLAALAGKAGPSAAMSGDIGDLLGGKTSGELFVGVLGSRTIQDQLIEKFNLRKVYWDRDWESARKDLSRHTDISTDRKSGILSIKVSDHNPNRAAAMAREYIDQLNLTIVRLDTSQAHRERVFLEDRLVQVKQELEAAEKSFGDFASRNVALDVPVQAKAMVEATASLEGELIAAETELQGLRQIYADNNVRIRSIQARINELKSQIQKLGGTSQTSGAGVSDSDSIYPSLRRLPVLGVTYADLLRQTKTEEVVFETLTEQYELAKVEEAKELPTVKVLDQPDIPEKRSFPPRALITLLGGVSTLLLAATWLLCRSRWVQIDSNAPSKLLALKVMADIHQDFARLSPGGSDRNRLK